MTAFVHCDSVFAASGCVLMARCRRISDGDYATQADVDSISCTVSDWTTGAAVTVVSPTVAVADVIFDTLQTDGLWIKDTTGYNFKHVMDDDAFPEAGHVYRVKYTATPTSGPDYVLAEFQVTARA